MSHLTRREFIRLAGATAAGTLFYSTGCRSSQPASDQDTGDPPDSQAALPSQGLPAIPTTLDPAPGQAYLGVGRGPNPAEVTRAALSAIGGIERFVRSGQQVIIKPNICVDYHPPEFAATTNPGVVGALVSMCIHAGAKRVQVLDSPFGGTPKSAYQISGIAEAVNAAGGEMVVMAPAKFKGYEIPHGKDLKEIEIYSDIMEADLVINVPIAKHHSLARLSLGGKNLLGVISNRGAMHANLGQRIADLVSAVRPALTVIDATRILMDHGPTGGSLEDVKLANTVIASHDIVAADTYAASLFGKTGAEISYIQASADMGLGTMDLNSVKIEEVSL